MTSAAWVLVFILSVTDGDTVRLLYPTTSTPNIGVWLEQDARIFGIDTPELHKGCPTEKKHGLEAKKAVERLLPSHAPAFASLKETSDKYGRVLVELRTITNVDIGGELLKRGLAKPYFGKGPKPNWCTTQ